RDPPRRRIRGPLSDAHGDAVRAGAPDPRGPLGVDDLPLREPADVLGHRRRVLDDPGPAPFPRAGAAGLAARSAARRSAARAAPDAAPPALSLQRPEQRAAAGLPGPGGRGADDPAPGGAAAAEPGGRRGAARAAVARARVPGDVPRDPEDPVPGPAAGRVRRSGGSLLGARSEPDPPAAGRERDQARR